MILSIDGNNSLKQLSRPDHQETKKELGSTYYLTTDDVDRFKDDVKNHIKKKRKLGISTDIETLEPDGQPVDGTIGGMACTDHWKVL